jgi:hypothetical protein
VTAAGSADAVPSILAAVRDGDPARVVSLVTALSDRARREIAPAIAEEFTRLDRPRGSAADEVELRRWQAAALARLATGPARELGFWWFTFEPLRPRADDAVAVIQDRGKRFLDTLLRALLRDQRGDGWWLVRALVRAGVIERPPPEQYIPPMVTSLRAGDWWSVDSIYDGLLADPDLLDEEVWLIFEIDVTSELTNSRVYAQRGEGYGLDTTGENKWISALVRLAAEGRLPRERLLGCSLAALTRDFRASMVGWHANLHEALRPTRDERLKLLDRYLILLGSPVPPVVKCGLSGVKAAADAVDPEALAAAAVGPLALRQKNLAVETLGLLQRCAERHPGAAAELATAAATGLLHERPDVQERTLRLIEATPGVASSGSLRAALLGALDAVSPVLRPRVEALAGISLNADAAPASLLTVADLEAAISELPLDIRDASGAARAVEAARAGSWPPARVPRMTAQLLRAGRATVEPLHDHNETLALAASLLEGQGNGDDAERLLDAVSRLCASTPPGFAQRASGVLQRADELTPNPGAWVLEGRQLIAILVRSWLGRSKPPRPTTASTAFGILSARVIEVSRRAAHGSAQPLLATPTHDGGWIDPATLAERERSAGRLRGRPSDLDRAQAHIRASFPQLLGPATARHEFQPSRWGGDESTVVVDLPRADIHLGPFQPLIEAVHGPSRWWWSPAKNVPLPGWFATDPLGVRWLSTLVPWLPDANIAAAAIRLWPEFDSNNVEGLPEIALERALDEDTALRDVTWLALAEGLVARSPQVGRITTDVLITAIEDGRFDPAALAAGLAWLLARGRGVLTRAVAPLRDIARVSVLHAAQTFRLLNEIAATTPTPPRNFYALLELMLELGIELDAQIEPSARAALERVSREASASSKLGRTARSLTELTPSTSSRLDQARLRAAAAVVNATSRWIKQQPLGETAVRVPLLSDS